MAKYLAIGDSITAERGFAGITVYSQDIKALLDADHPGRYGAYTTGFAVVGAGVVNHGHGGWATQDYVNGVGDGFLDVWTTEALNEDADIITIMLGTNDHAISDGQTLPRVPIATYETTLNSLIDQVQVDTPSALIVLLTPPPVRSYTNVGGTVTDNALCGDYADVVRNVAVQQGCKVIDVYDTLWQLSGKNETTFTTTYTLDDVHLNQTGQDIILNLVKSVIDEYEAANVATMQRTVGGSTEQIYKAYTGKTFSLDGITYYAEDGGVCSETASIGLTAYT